MAELSTAGKNEKGMTRVGMSVEDVGERLAAIWELSSEEPVKDALGKLMLDVLRSGKWEPIVEPSRPTSPEPDRTDM
jgi:hypothetical protein